MRKILFSLIVLAALTLEAGAQWNRPAREVWAASNTWSYIPVTKWSVQEVIDWLDDEMATFDSRLDSVLPTNVTWRVLPDTNALGPLFTWIDDNWNTSVVPGEVYIPGSNIIGATRSGRDWSIPASGVGISTGGWSAINPASTNVQAALDAINAWAGYANSNLNVATVAGAAKLAYNNGFGANRPTNSFNSGTKAVFTNGMDSALNSNTNILKWETNGRLTIKRAGTYFYYSSQAAYRTSSAGVFAYAYHYNSAGTLKTASSITAVDQIPDYSEGAGVLVAIDAEVDDYFVTQFAAPGTNTWQGSVVLGAQYIFAYKVYNTD